MTPCPVQKPVVPPGVLPGEFDTTVKDMVEFFATPLREATTVTKATPVMVLAVKVALGPVGLRLAVTPVSDQE